MREGRFASVDTLCTIFDEEGTIDDFSLLHWVEAKQTLEDYGSVAGLICRIVNNQPKLTPAALNRFESILSTVSAVVADTLIRNFIDCVFAQKEVDTASIVTWIADQYGRKELFGGQIETIATLEKNINRKCKYLLSTAKQHYGMKRYMYVVTAARILHNITTDSTIRREAALILFRAYNSRGLTDSAKLWLEHVDNFSDKERIEAIGFYQKTGDFTKASALISKLPKSVASDTLYLRQLLLNDNIAAALRFADSGSTVLARSAQERILWRIRTTLFGGKTDKCLALLDSVKIDPSAPFASELLDYHYWLLRLAGNSTALAKFSQIEYTLFKGRRDQASGLLCGAVSMLGDKAWRIALRIAARQLDNSEASEAIATLRCAPAEKEPEYLYRLAEAKFRGGASVEARRILETLMIDFPSDIYAVQARIMLQQLKPQ